MPFSSIEMQKNEISKDNEPLNILSFSLKDFNSHQFVMQAKEYGLYAGVFSVMLCLFLGIWYIMPSFLSSDHTDKMTLHSEENNELNADILLKSHDIKAVYE